MDSSNCGGQLGIIGEGLASPDPIPIIIGLSAAIFTYFSCDDTANESGFNQSIMFISSVRPEFVQFV